MWERRPDFHHAATRFSHSCLFVCLATLLLTSTGCAKRDSNSETDLLRLSQRNEPATLDPHLATLPDEYFVIRALSEGLLVPDPEGGAPLPGAAEKWESSPDGRRYTFTLRANARWSNGDPVTAQDFVSSCRRVLTASLAAPEASQLFVLRNAAAFYRGEIADFSAVGVHAPDSHTLVLELEHPTPHLPALVAAGPWIPVHRTTLEKFGAATTRDGRWTRPGNYVGNGPFVLTEWRASQHLRVAPNPHYHDAARVRVSGIRFQIYDNGDTEERAFRAGQVDITMAVPTAKLDTYQAPTLQRIPLHETRFFAINTTRPPLDDARIRRALALAIDRTTLVENVLRGGQQPALNFIPPGLGSYTNLPSWREDADAARALLANAGFPGGQNFPRLELTTWVNTPVLEAIQQMWRRELGIETTIVQREGKVHMASLHSGDFTIAFTPAIPDYDDAAALFDEFTAGASGNYSRWHNARYDELVRQAGRTVDRARRFALYRQAEEILLSEVPIVPLYFNSQNYLISPRVQGWRQDALWNRYYLDVLLK